MTEEARTSLAIHRQIRAVGEVERLAAIFGMGVEISMWGSIHPDAGGPWVTPEMVRRRRNAAQKLCKLVAASALGTELTWNEDSSGVVSLTPKLLESPKQSPQVAQEIQRRIILDL